MIPRFISRSVASTTNIKSCYGSSLLMIRRLIAAAASQEESTAIDMIQYAKSKSLANDEPSYSEAVRVLQQGLSYFRGDQLPAAMASSRLQLSLATVHANRSNFNEAEECLQQLLNMSLAPLVVKGAAFEALVGLCIQMNQDEAAAGHVESFTKLLTGAADNLPTEQLQALKCQSLALQKLAELAYGISDAEVPSSSFMDSENASGASLLALAEFSHVNGSFELAKSFYKRAIDLSENQIKENGDSLSAIMMMPEAVKTGSLAGLGQLMSVTGKFEDAEIYLTEALKLAEKVKGEKHPQVGAILSCIGNLYERRALTQGSSELLLTEGMYKSSLDLMKAPALDHNSDQACEHTDVTALTRARLGITLAPATNRRSEVEKLYNWVEAVWKKSPPLAEMVYLKHLLTGNNRGAVEERRNKIGETTLIDVRFGRVFYK